LNYHFDVAVIGGGILGSSIAYFLATSTKSKVVVLEQESNFGMHASGRNTGRVHAPFLYHPDERRLTAKAALKGFEMLKEYCHLNNLPFKEDGVIEVATSEEEAYVLDKYLKWGLSNGLSEAELKQFTRDEILRIEPNVNCHSAIICFRDAATDYGLITKQIIEDAQKFGCSILPNYKFLKFSANNNHIVTIGKESKKEISADYVINATGGSSLDIAHSMGLAEGYENLYFKGEYWQAPQLYFDLTHRSIYSVPKHAEYPFLDPHWILRVDGRREIGPNAVPVFSPYSYSWRDDFKGSLIKISESFSKGPVLKLMMKPEFIRLISKEFWSSLSKNAMIGRVREFLPALKPSAFTNRGSAGIRSSLIDTNGDFVPEMLIVENKDSLHVLNYNSPGATGSLPIAAKIVWRLIIDGHVQSSDRNTAQLWKIDEISDSL
jgi:(S)-2-hydroxyglutarate dehydrogenase